MKRLVYSLPLAASLFACRHTDGASQTKFDTGEHALLGDAGFQQALDAAGMKSLPIKAPASGVGSKAPNGGVYSYGDIVAYSGDYSDSYSEFLKGGGTWHPLTIDPSYVRNVELIEICGIDAKKCQDWIDTKSNGKQASTGSTQSSDPTAPFPDASDAKNLGGPNYIHYGILAANNFKHFGWYNVKTYVLYHEKAIRLAINAAAESDPSRKAALLNEALVANGFADHFLTDSFAAGHIRVPRKELLNHLAYVYRPKSDAKTNQPLPEPSPAPEVDLKTLSPLILAEAGSMSRILHDSDPCRGNVSPKNLCHDFASEADQIRTLSVRNSRGDHWLARGDADLYRGVDPQDSSNESIKYPIEAVASSVGDVLRAYQTGLAPTGVFAALNIVPFPDVSLERTIAQDFGAAITEAQFASEVEDIGILGKSISSAAMLNRVFKDLPKIMADFRIHIAQDADASTIMEDPTGEGPSVHVVFRDRVPEAYRDAFKNLDITH